MFAPDQSLGSALTCNPNLRLTTADYECTNVDKPNMDITAIPYVENSLTGVVAVHLLEHIPDYRKAIHEVYRVLKPGGFALLPTPFNDVIQANQEDPACVSEQCRTAAFGQGDHVRLYSRSGLHEAFASAGFKVAVHDFRQNAAAMRAMQLSYTMQNSPETKVYGNINLMDTIFWVLTK